MARSILSHETTADQVPGKNPVQSGTGLPAIVSRRKHVFGRLEAVRLRDADGKPDEVEQHIDDNDGHTRSEHPGVHARRQEIERGSDGQEQK